MKRLALAVIAAAGLAATSARADHVSFRGFFNFGGPAYVAPAPVYYPPAAPAGYWRTVETQVWIPGHWVVQRDFNGYEYNQWVPGHTECRTQQVWVDSYPRRDWDHERWEHEQHERWEQHERSEHRDWDGDRR